MLDRRTVASAALLVSLSAPAAGQACTTDAVNVTPSGAISTDDPDPAGLGTRATWLGTSHDPGPSDATVSVRGQVPAGGAVRRDRIWYRIAAPFCTPATFSFSNAVSIAWTP